MSGRTGCICHTTRWLLFWPRTEARTLSLLLGIWIRKSRTFYVSVRFEEHVSCGDWGTHVSGQAIEMTYTPPILLIDLAFESSKEPREPIFTWAV